MMKTTKPLVIFGAGAMAELARRYFEADGGRKVAAFSVDGAYVTVPQFLGLPLVPFETVEQAFPPDQFDLFVAMGYNRMNRTRAAKFADAKAKGYRLASYVSPRATCVDPIVPGENVFIFEDNTIQPFVSIGNDTILWSGNHIGHHTRIGDHCFVASHVCIGGGVTVGDYSFFGVNATVSDGVKIGEASLIGAGSLILSDTAASSVYTAAPTEPRRRITSDRVKL